ncbi:hypothetical protein FDA52_04965 [Clostridium botulinum]|nr:hypothetical protein [Clostridium botulinum]NFI52322.1 hypothetical protein [Clostridium botulinum]
MYGINHDKLHKRCTRCAITSEYPNVTFNENGVCSICNNFDKYKYEVMKYFRPYNEFEKIIDKCKKVKNKYDCMLLYSGGKDSSYVLYKLVEEGLNVLAFTFDNGFISNEAFKNINRITKKLGVDSVILKHENMNKIFVEDLKSNCTVCTGCFKVLTCMSTKLAVENNISLIISGLSRGQIFETKLKDLYNDGVYDVEQIESYIKLFRKMYHKTNNELSRLIGIDISDDEIDAIEFIDYYRYDGVSISDIKKYLKEVDEFWKIPIDTGFCSSNCIINDVGVYMHIKNKNYHNYSGPLNYDYRLGISERQEVIDDLKVNISEEKVKKILEEIGYEEEKDDGIIFDTMNT